MTQYLIMCPSLTGAQKIQRIFERAGIRASVVKAPSGLYTNGCGYAVSLHGNIERARALLQKNNTAYGKIYKRTDKGEYELPE